MESTLDLNTLNTPHKLAAFVVNILDKENEYLSKPLTPVNRVDAVTSNNRLNEDEKDMTHDIYDPLQNEVNQMDMNINLISPPPFISNFDEVKLSKSTDSEDGKDEQKSYGAYDESSNSNKEDVMNDSTYIMHQMYETAPGMPKQEKDVLLRIAKVLYEHSWSGEMISLSTQFNRSEYNALLNVGGVPIGSYTSNLVWKILSSLQKHVQDDLINENKEHIKWYWWDGNVNDIDYSYNWKWRKYNVVICEWISKQYQLYLNDNSHNDIEFKLCQQELQRNHKELLGDKLDNDMKEREIISIDPYFGQDNEYCHHLVIEKDELNDGNILLWHKITNDEIEYFREIRLRYKLFDVKQDMIVHKYEQYPSPFAIPPQMNIDLT